MRSPRVVVDYHVDRREVQVQRCTEPTRTNSPITFVSSFRSSLSRHTGSRLWGFRKHKRRRRGGATPLPIPNREVKPACADGTARKGGRAGGCRLWGATTDRSMVTTCRRRPFLFCTPSPSSFLPSHFPSFLPPFQTPPRPCRGRGRRPVPPPARERSSRLSERVFAPVLAAAETGSKCTCHISVLFRWKKHGRPPRNAAARHASVLSAWKKHVLSSAIHAGKCGFTTFRG